MKLKRGGAYVDASPFIKRGGVYEAVSALVKSGGGYLAAGLAPNEDPIAPTLDLGDLTVDTGFVVSSAELLAGATDADGDTLTVTSVTAVSGGTVTGTGPWTITPTDEGAGSATVVISDGRGGSVNRAVTWNGVASSGLSGGDAALAWSAASLDDGAEITITTDGTYNFGTTPTVVGQLGFGEGWMYNQPLLTVLAGGTMMDGFKVSEGDARRIEQVGAIRAFASRLIDPSGWAGLKKAGRIISWETGDLTPGSRVAVFSSIRIDSPVPPLNWQYKIQRYHPTDNTVGEPGEVGVFNWRARGYVLMRTSQEPPGATNSYSDVALPHVNYGWQSFAWAQEWGTGGVVDGQCITRCIGEDDFRHVREASQLVMTHDGIAPLSKYWLAQDYIDDSSGTTYEPANIDLYLTDIQIQQGAFGAVYLADAPTPSEARNAILLPTKIAPSVAWAANEVKVRMWKQGRNWPVMYLHIYSGTTGLFVGSVNVTGTYVPPAWDEYSDTIGLQRGTGNASSAKRILIADVTNTAGTTQKWRWYVSPSQLTTTMSPAGGSSALGLYFLPDGSVTLRTGGMVAEPPIRAAGEHLLTVGQRHVLELELAGTIASVYLDGTPIGTVSGTNLTHGFTKLLEGGAYNSGWIGKMYSAQYWEDGILLHQWRLSEGSGLVAADSVGTVNGTVGADLIWVSA